MHAKWTRIKNNTTQNKNSEKKGTTYSVLTMKIHVWIRKCQDPAKSAPSIGFLTVLTTIPVADLDYVIMSSSCKVKKKGGDADISETDLVSDNINPLHGKLLSLQLQSSITIIFDRDRKKIRRHFDACHWEPMKLSQISHVIW